MPKYSVEGSPSDGYRIWLTTAEGDVIEQESPPFHAPCEAWWWGFQRGIDSEIETFQLVPGNTDCELCQRYNDMLVMKRSDPLNHQLIAYMAKESVQNEVKWNGAKHSRIQTKANGHTAHRKEKRKAQRDARKRK